MVDFLRIATRSSRKGIVEVYPKFIVVKSSDLMIKGGDFYAADPQCWKEVKKDA